MSQNQSDNYPYEPEFSLKKLITDRFADLKYVFQFKKSLITVIILGALGGAFIAWFKRPTYTARLTFVIDDSKSSGASGGGLAALAGLAGFDLNGIGGNSGVLAGDNVQELVKSTMLIKKTLLTPYDSTQTLADRYAAVNKLNKQWLKYSADGKIIRFPAGGQHNTRLQDSLLHEMTELILANQFGIAKPDKKLDFFEVNVTMKDEKLALLFCERIIQESTEFFITTKTKRLRSNVNRLQFRVDSIGKLLNRKTTSVLAANRDILDLNPGYISASANVEVSSREKTLLSSIYSETVKNLEASKTMLAQETPTVQLVDQPELPLKKNKLKYPVTIFGGVILGVILLSFYLLLTRKTVKI